MRKVIELKKGGIIMIKLLDIDYRLIHGQVMLGWVRGMKIEYLIVVDDEVVNNKFTLSMMKLGIPSGVKYQFISSNEIDHILNDELCNKYNTMILCGNVETGLKIAEKVNFSLINISNSKHKEGSKAYSKCCFLTEQEEEIVKIMIRKGIEVTSYPVPGDKSGIQLNKILN